jgi:adenylate cyclase
MEQREGFVGRGEELAYLSARLGSAVEARGQLCFVAGEAGAGKTALVAEFCRLAQQQHGDLIVAGGTCDAQTGIGDAYLPFREVLGTLAGNVDSKVTRGAAGEENRRRVRDVFILLGEVLVEIGPDLIDLFVPGVGLLTKAGQFVVEKTTWADKLKERLDKKGAGKLLAGEGLDQNQILEQYVNVLRAVAGKRVLVVVLEDLQWADAASLGLLFRLARRLEGSRILLIGTYRPNDVAAGRGGERHPLAPVVAEIKRYYGSVEIDLDLARAQRGREFVDAYLDLYFNCLDESFRQALYRHTGGHALFTVELVREMMDRHSLVQDWAGCWHEAPGLNWADLPARIEGLIDERIGRLSGTLREQLSIASVEGERFTAEVIARIVSTEVRDVVRHMSGELQKEHRLVEGEGIERLGAQRLSRYRFAHNLVQTYLYARLDEVEAPLLHEDVGNALEALYGDQASDIAVQLAYHFERAGVDDKARRYLFLAGEQAAARFDYVQALAHLERAWQMTPEADLEARYALLSSRERIYEVQGEREAQARDLSALRALAERFADPRRQAAVALRDASYALQTGQPATAAQAAERSAMLAVQAGDRLAEARAQHRWGRAYWQAGDYPRARPHLEQALALATAEGSDVDRARTLYDLSVVDYYSGNSQAALNTLEDAAHLYRALDDRRGEIRCANLAGNISFSLGRPTEAADHRERALGLAREVGWRYAQTVILAQSSTHLCDLGDLDTSRRLQQQALDICHEIGDEEGKATGLDMLGLIAYMQGEDATARLFLQQAVDAHRALGNLRGQGYALTHLGYSLGRQGAWSAAAGVFEEALTLRRQSGAGGLILDSLGGLALAALHTGDPATALAHVDEIEAWLAEQGVSGIEYPVQVYLACYHVLDALAAGSPALRGRAEAVLQAGYDLLITRRDAIGDDRARRQFMENIPFNRVLYEARAQAKRDE